MSLNYVATDSMPLPTVSWGEDWANMQESHFESVIPDMPKNIAFYSERLDEFHQFLGCDQSGAK
jgi:hypothetical protein